MSRNTEQSAAKSEAEKLSKLRNSSEGKLIITHINDKLCAFLSVEGRIDSITVIGDMDLAPDDIIIAYIKDVKNMVDYQTENYETTQNVEYMASKNDKKRKNQILMMDEEQ